MASSLTTLRPTRIRSQPQPFPLRLRREMPLLAAIAEEMPWINGDARERLAAARRLLAEVIGSTGSRSRRLRRDVAYAAAHRPRERE